jgi:hypothetical protein
MKTFLVTGFIKKNSIEKYLGVQFSASTPLSVLVIAGARKVALDKQLLIQTGLELIHYLTQS